jgi:quinol-cytochrome oxidoreductase complex cytochrome b subunit
VGLLLVTLSLSFTGYLLPWDQLAYWAITVGTSIAGYAPVVGEKLKYLMLGGHVVGQDSLTRFYALHVIVLPAIAILMISVHLFRVRKDGGLSRPEEAGDVVEQIPLGQLPANKSYGLMELARGATPQVGRNPEEEVFSWPHLVFRELLLLLLVTAVVLFLAIFWNAPLEEIANAVHPPNPAKAPWYFLGLQELVSYSAFWGGVVVPGLLVAALALLPYIDRQPQGMGRWFARERVVANTIFSVCLAIAVIFTVIGCLFRGPNWSWVEPWKKPPAVTEGQ